MSTPLVLAPDVQAHLVLLATQMGERTVNGYHCPKCGRTMLVSHVDEGVTPMFVACRSTEGCDGQSHSLGYPTEPVPSHFGSVTHEWYRPSQEEFEGLSESMREHVSNGGLILREKSS